jgi:hypothetical protein
VAPGKRTLGTKQGGAAMSYVMFGIFFILCVCWLFYVWWLQDEGHNTAAVVLNILVVITVYFTAIYKEWEMVQPKETEQKIVSCHSMEADASSSTNTSQQISTPGGKLQPIGVATDEDLYMEGRGLQEQGSESPGD